MFTFFHALGYGIGSFLGGLFRYVVPLIKRGSIAIGKQLLKTSADVVDDITENDVPLETAVIKRGIEAVKNLKRKAAEKMSGSGLNCARKKSNQSSLKSSRGKSKCSKKKAAVIQKKNKKKKSESKVSSANFAYL